MLYLHAFFLSLRRPVIPLTAASAHPVSDAYCQSRNSTAQYRGKGFLGQNSPGPVSRMPPTVTTRSDRAGTSPPGKSECREPETFPTAGLAQLWICHSGLTGVRTDRVVPSGDQAPELRTPCCLLQQLQWTNRLPRRAPRRPTRLWTQKPASRWCRLDRAYRSKISLVTRDCVGVCKRAK